ncbi:MAG: hypothetical protein FWB78_08840 [Treponema sp.]|nr:hypothetical protein [Treponema sp.]
MDKIDSVKIYLPKEQREYKVGQSESGYKGEPTVKNISWRSTDGVTILEVIFEGEKGPDRTLTFHNVPFVCEVPA